MICNPSLVRVVDCCAGSVSGMPRKFQSAAQYWQSLLALIQSRSDIGSTTPPIHTTLHTTKVTSNHLDLSTLIFTLELLNILTIHAPVHDIACRHLSHVSRLCVCPARMCCQRATRSSTHTHHPPRPVQTQTRCEIEAKLIRN